MPSLLSKLSLESVNLGACTGPDGWIREPDGHKLTSFNPTTGDPIATVTLASPSAYDQVVTAATTAFRTWREVPAPKRGAFKLAMRLYGPKKEVIDGSWAPPSVRVLH